MIRAGVDLAKNTKNVVAGDGDAIWAVRIVRIVSKFLVKHVLLLIHIRELTTRPSVHDR